MEEKKESDRVMEEHIRRIVEPIFNKVLQEDPNKSISPPHSFLNKTFKILWRPNNYRRKIRVRTKTDSTIYHLKVKLLNTGYKPKTDSTNSTIDNSKGCYYLNAQNKLLFVKNYHGVTIQYGKNYLTGIYSDIGKQAFLIEANSIDDLEERIDQKKKEILAKIDSALFMFIKEFNLGLPFEKPVWDRYEDWVKGEDYIDKLPKDLIVHDTYFKKVYGEGIEFMNKEAEPTVHLKHYIKNRAIEDIAPEIAQELATIKEIVKGVLEVNADTSRTFNSFSKGVTPILSDFAINIKTHNKVLKGIDKSFRKFNSLLSQKKIGDYA